MRTYNHLFVNSESVRGFLGGVEIGEGNSVLVRIHSAIHSGEDMNELVKLVKSELPGAHVIGCSATQIINEGRLVSDACLISISVFEKADIITGRAACRNFWNEWRSGSEVGSEILAKISSAPNGGFMLVFFPLAYSKIEEFVESVNLSKRSIKMLGGAAYHEDEKGNPIGELAYVVEDDRTSDHEVVFAYISAKELKVYGDFACGVEAVGRKCSIISDGCFIEQVDGMSGAEWYSSMLDADQLRRNLSLAHVFPLVKHGERGVAYYVDYIPWETDNDGKTVFRLKSFGELKSGSRVSLGYFNPRNIFNQVTDVMRNVRKSPAETLYAYDCQSRMSLLHNCASWEISNFNTTNISGALLSGEISSRNGINLYANYTFVVAALSESEDSHFLLDTPDEGTMQDLQEDNAQMLNYLLLNANKHLSDELQEQQEKMQDAVFFNSAVGVDNHLKYLFDKEREGLDKTAIFGLNNVKMLRLFSGVTETYGFLRDCYHDIQDKYNKHGLYFYCYDDTSLFIAANNNISEKEFVDIVDDIHEFINNCVYEDIKLSFTTCVLLGAEDTIHRLEITLNYARTHKLDKIRFDEIGEDLKNEQEDVHLLWVIREALVHRWVIPYFQEIHDNIGGEKRIFESLLRVADANGKIYYPNQILPVAKEFDLYESLSELMVKSVFKMMEGKNVRVSINLNVQDIYNRNMIKTIFGHMQKTEYPENFIFEIVESEEITDYEYIKGFSDRIHEYGGKIAIDDFGSGFSNIMHVLNIGADYIKVDGNIVRTIKTEPRCRDFIEFMNSWCQKMGQQLICEYIEDEEIQTIMNKIGVPYSQGYYFSIPHMWGPEDEE